MLQQFLTYIDQQHLFAPGQEVLLAVSGGRDSVAMVDLMQRGGFRFAVAHCNFHLRPHEAERDQHFVEHLAARIGVPFHTVGFDTRQHATRHGLSIEEAARQLRYAYFSDLCREYGYACVATAHHRDDSVETFFLNLFRGTGIAGLHGIRPRSGSVVRPMLCFSRADIDRYVSIRRLAYVDDSTNALTDARRNRIRLQLMPLLRELYPEVDRTMEANIERLYETEQVFAQHVEALRQRIIAPAPSPVLGQRLAIVGLQVADVAALSPRRTLLFELLRPYGFGIDAVDSLLASLSSPQSGKVFLSASHELVVDRGRWLIAPRVEPRPPQVGIEELPAEAFAVPSSSAEAMVDADGVHLPLSLRPWRSGDRFMPFGMKHHRLVSDFVGDLKLSRIDKEHLFLLVDADDRIVWLPGLRIDNRFRVSPSTARLLRLTLLD